jgi:hypothetical protein
MGVGSTGDYSFPSPFLNRIGTLDDSISKIIGLAIAYCCLCYRAGRNKVTECVVIANVTGATRARTLSWKAAAEGIPSNGYGDARHTSPCLSSKYQYRNLSILKSRFSA